MLNVLANRRNGVEQTVQPVSGRAFGHDLGTQEGVDEPQKALAGERRRAVGSRPDWGLRASWP